MAESSRRNLEVLGVVMKTRAVIAISVAIAGLCASTAVYAAPTNIHSPVPAMFEQTKMVKVTLRNNSNAAMELKVGENIVKLEAGKSVALKLPIGTRISANTATVAHPAGSLIEEVTADLDGATLGIH
jgi:hypothetical protein